MTRVLSAPIFEQLDPIDRFFHLLLQLERTDAVAVLDQALELLAQIARARLAYIELRDDDGHATFSRGYHVDRHDPVDVMDPADVEHARSAIARDVVIALPPRRAKREVGAILCVPIRSHDTVGFLWLQGRPSAFTLADTARAAWLAHRVGALGLIGTRRTLHEELRALRDRRVRETVQRSYGNVSKAARELEVSRPFITKVLKGRKRSSR